MHKLLILLLISLFSQQAFSSEAMYVQSMKAKILEKPAFSAKIIQTLNRGTKVQVVESSGNWIKVKHDNTVGWTSRLILAPNPPHGKQSILSGKEKQLKDNARRRASGTATAAATRGLQEEGRIRANDSNRADYVALDKLEAEKVSEEETWKFHEDGIMKDK